MINVYILHLLIIQPVLFSDLYMEHGFGNNCNFYKINVDHRCPILLDLRQSLLDVLVQRV